MLKNPIKAPNIPISMSIIATSLMRKRLFKNLLFIGFLC